MSKGNSAIDTIMLVLTLQRVVDLGGCLIGLVHSLSRFENEALDVQKMLKIMTID
jgi:hypothetical protein